MEPLQRNPYNCHFACLAHAWSWKLREIQNLQEGLFLGKMGFKDSLYDYFLCSNTITLALEIESS